MLPRSGFHVVRRGENDGKEKEDVINRGQVGSADPPPQPVGQGSCRCLNSLRNPCWAGLPPRYLARVGSWMGRSALDAFVQRVLEANPHVQGWVRVELSIRSSIRGRPKPLDHHSTAALFKKSPRGRRRAYRREHLDTFPIGHSLRWCLAPSTCRPKLHRTAGPSHVKLLSYLFYAISSIATPSAKEKIWPAGGVEMTWRPRFDVVGFDGLNLVRTKRRLEVRL